MYCEKCKRMVEAACCPHCGSRKVRMPEAGDLVLLAEEDYITTGILEDLLRQEGIPYLKKDVMGAGMAIKVGPMLERSRFYVPFDRLQDAVSVMDEVFPASPAGEENEPNG